MKRGQGEEVKMAMKLNLIFFWRIGRDCIHPSGSKPSPLTWEWLHGTFKYLSFWRWVIVPPLNLIIWRSVTSGLFSGNWRDPNLLALPTSALGFFGYAITVFFCETPLTNMDSPEHCWKSPTFPAIGPLRLGHVNSHNPKEVIENCPGIYGCFQK